MLWCHRSWMIVSCNTPPPSFPSSRRNCVLICCYATPITGRAWVVFSILFKLCSHPLLSSQLHNGRKAFSSRLAPNCDLERCVYWPKPLTRGRRITDVAAGTYSTFARTADGQVYAWGLNNYGQLGLPGQEPIFAPTLVAALTGKGVKEVVAGQHHTLAITQVRLRLSPPGV